MAERRNPRTSATVDQLLERYLDQLDGKPNTLTLYHGYVRNHISPFLGQTSAATSRAPIDDRFDVVPLQIRSNLRKQLTARLAAPRSLDDLSVARYALDAERQEADRQALADDRFLLRLRQAAIAHGRRSLPRPA